MSASTTSAATGVTMPSHRRAAGRNVPSGEVKGQGVNDVWWVLTPEGERMAG